MPEPIVGIHLDLKYQMPEKTWLLHWVQRLPTLGINTLLLEYEDKFPFARYPFLQAADAFTPQELRHFLSTARQAGLRVVPLVQTLSHLEFALAHAQLAQLREAPDVPTQICPSNPAAVQFVRDLLGEVLAYHESDEWFHLGADEAWFLGTCAACAARGGGDKRRLWMEHTVPLCEFMLQRGKRPLVWDDTFNGAPDQIATLPRRTIPVSWEYGLTAFRDDRYPAPNLAASRRHGYDCLGAPCLNWGVFVPQPHCLHNTAAWAAKVRQDGLLGILNTAWACFHVPIPNTMLQIAATGALMRGTDATTPAWQEAFLHEEFGVDPAGLVEALAVLGEVWEVRIEGLGRPLTPIGYGYMDMVAHYRGGQDERRRRGAYPLDWHEVDFAALYQRKLTLLRAHPEAEAIRQRAAAFVERATQARTVLRRVATTAQRHQEEAALLALGLRLKLLQAQALVCLLGGAGDRAALAREFAPLRPMLADVLLHFYEEPSAERLLGLWWEPVAAALAAPAAG